MSKKEATKAAETSIFLEAIESTKFFIFSDCSTPISNLSQSPAFGGSSGSVGEPEDPRAHLYRARKGDGGDSLKYLFADAKSWGSHVSSCGISSAIKAAGRLN